MRVAKWGMHVATSLRSLSATGVMRVNTDDMAESTSPRIQVGNAIWLLIFCLTGISIGMTFEILQLHAGPARYKTFFLALLGYWAQFVASGSWLLYTGTWKRGTWSRGCVIALVFSACLDGSAQALNYVAQIQGGIMLFTIFQSSVTLFACLVALLLPWTPRLHWKQWIGVCLIVAGLMLTSIPNPIVARQSFVLGLACSMLGSLCLACSYPICELVFKLSPAPPSEEMACFCGSVVNVVAFSTWTAVYTIPRWREAVVQPIYEASSPSIGWAIFGYTLFAFLIGTHALCFWKAVHCMGTVPTAVSKGVQQSGVFLFAHILFCHQDPTECLWNNDHTKANTLWNRWQKSAALACCCTGVMIYSLSKRPVRPAMPETMEPAPTIDSEYATTELISYSAAAECSSDKNFDT